MKYFGLPKNIIIKNNNSGTLECALRQTFRPIMYNVVSLPNAEKSIRRWFNLVISLSGSRGSC